MGKKISDEKIERQKGYLYFIGKDGLVHEVPMALNLKKSGFKKSIVSKTPISKKPGFLYYINKDGYPSEAPMKNAKAKK